MFIPLGAIGNFFLLVGFTSILASMLMSGNLNPLSWKGHSFLSSFLNVLGGVTLLVATTLHIMAAWYKAKNPKKVAPPYEPSCVIQNWPHGHDYYDQDPSNVGHRY